MNRLLNRKSIIISITLIFILIFSMNLLTFFFLKQHERNLNESFYDQMELLSIYWKSIFIADELETIEPGMEFQNIPIYYQNMLIQLSNNLPLTDVKILDVDQRILVDYQPVYTIGTKISIDPLYWKTAFEQYEKPAIFTHADHDPPQVTVLLPLFNSLDEIKAVLYLNIQPGFLQNIESFKQFIYFYIYFTLLLSIIFASAILYLFVKYSGMMAEKHHQERLIQMGHLAATMAHEIRNPLGIMKGSTHLLRKKSENEENRQLANYIEEEINRLNDLISQFLQFVKKPRADIMPYSINSIMDEILPRYQQEHPEIKFNQNLEDVEILADKNLLRQVFMNILHNAVSALAGQKTQTPTILFSGKIEKKRFFLYIENNGPQIPTKILGKIFDPFFTTKEQGSGLGLPICKMLMQGMSGDIDIENTKESPGVKTTLVFLRK